MASFIIYCLTGEKVSDPSLASRTMMLDINKLGWSRNYWLRREYKNRSCRESGDWRNRWEDKKVGGG